MSGSSQSINDTIVRLIKREGGWVNDADDRGGETRYGISRNAYPEEDIAGMTPERATFLYKRDYWAKPGFDMLPVDYAEPVFDHGVNAGPRPAIVLAQLAAGLRKADADGILGPQTVKAITALPLRTFLRNFALERLLHYLTIILVRPANQKFARGWFRRALEFLP